MVYLDCRSAISPLTFAKSLYSSVQKHQRNQTRPLNPQGLLSGPFSDEVGHCMTLLDLGSMYSEQDPCGCSVEQPDIDLGQIQVEAASTQPFNFEGLSNLTRSTQPDTTRLLEFYRSNGNGTCLRCLESLDVLQDFASVRCTTFEACERRSGMAPELGVSLLMCPRRIAPRQF